MTSKKGDIYITIFDKDMRHVDSDQTTVSCWGWSEILTTSCFGGRYVSLSAEAMETACMRRETGVVISEPGLLERKFALRDDWDESSSWLCSDGTGAIELLREWWPPVGCISHSSNAPIDRFAPYVGRGVSIGTVSIVDRRLPTSSRDNWDDRNPA